MMDFKIFFILYNFCDNCMDWDKPMRIVIIEMSSDKYE